MGSNNNFNNSKKDQVIHPSGFPFDFIVGLYNAYKTYAPFSAESNRNPYNYVNENSFSEYLTLKEAITDSDFIQDLSEFSEKLLQFHFTNKRLEEVRDFSEFLSDVGLPPPLPKRKKFNLSKLSKSFLDSQKLFLDLKNNDGYSVDTTKVKTQLKELLPSLLIIKFPHYVYDKNQDFIYPYGCPERMLRYLEMYKDKFSGTEVGKGEFLSLEEFLLVKNLAEDLELFPDEINPLKSRSSCNPAILKRVLKLSREERDDYLNGRDDDYLDGLNGPNCS